MPKYFITGASGFIGSHFHEILGAENIINYDLIPPTDGRGSVCVQGDVRDAGKMAETIKLHLCTTIINLAAAHKDFGISHKEYFSVNEGGMEAVCKAADNTGVKEIIFYSSVAVYGNNSEPSTEETEPSPINDYGGSKLAAEKKGFEWINGDNSKKLIVIRPALVFGEGNVANMYRLIHQIKKGRFFNVGRASNIKSVVYVKNLVNATLFLQSKQGNGAYLFNYADTPHLTSKEISQTIALALHQKAPRSLSEGLLVALAKPFDWVIKLTGKDLPISSKRIRKLNTQTFHKAEKILQTGFTPAFNTKQGLENMVKWYLSKNK